MARNIFKNQFVLLALIVASLSTMIGVAMGEAADPAALAFRVVGCTVLALAMKKFDLLGKISSAMGKPC